MKALIIDDERHSRELLSTLLGKYCTHITKIKLAASVELAIPIINEMEPDIVFLDIEMPQHSGFDLLDILTQVSFLTCFVTGYEQYAIKAIKYGAFDYILKPVNIDELINVVAKAEKTTKAPRINTPSLMIKSTNRIDVVQLQKILYLKAVGNYTDFYLSNNDTVSSAKKIGEYESLLPDSQFFRTHRSYIVNISSVVNLSSTRTGEIILKNGDALPVSSRKLSTLKGLL